MVAVEARAKDRRARPATSAEAAPSVGTRQTRVLFVCAHAADVGLRAHFVFGAAGETHDEAKENNLGHLALDNAGRWHKCRLCGQEYQGGVLRAWWRAAAIVIGPQTERLIALAMDILADYRSQLIEDRRKQLAVRRSWLYGNVKLGHQRLPRHNGQNRQLPDVPWSNRRGTATAAQHTLRQSQVWAGSR